MSIFMELFGNISESLSTLTATLGGKSTSVTLQHSVRQPAIQREWVKGNITLDFGEVFGDDPINTGISEIYSASFGGQITARYWGEDNQIHTIPYNINNWTFSHPRKISQQLLTMSIPDGWVEFSFHVAINYTLSGGPSSISFKYDDSESTNCRLGNSMEDYKVPLDNKIYSTQTFENKLENGYTSGFQFEGSFKIEGDNFDAYLKVSLL